MRLARAHAQRGFHHLGLILIVAVVGVVGLIGWRVYKKSPKPTSNHQSQQSAASNDAFMKQYGHDCQDHAVSFSSPPMAMGDLGYIRPLGAVADGHVTPTDHVYVVPANQNVADGTVPVLMPADGKIIEIDAMPAQYIGDNKDQKTAPEDHRLVISFSCRYYAIFIHVHKLADKLHALVGVQAPSTQKSVSVDMKAGELIGYDGPQGNDWVPIDTTVKLGFISPKLYDQEPWKIHTVSPFDLYSGSLKSQLEAKSLRSVAPIGGKIDYDQPGKLIGNWFRQSTNGYAGADQSRYWDGHLSVAPDYIDPTGTVVSIGNWDGTAKQLLVKGSADAAKVDAAAGMVKYELVGIGYTTDSGASWNPMMGLAKNLHTVVTGDTAGTIAFQVMAGEKLKVEKFPGKTAAQVSGFTSVAQTYER